MKITTQSLVLPLLAGLTVCLSACIHPESAVQDESGGDLQNVLQRSFVNSGVASIERLQQDAVQKTCSAYADRTLPADVARQIEQAQSALLPPAPTQIRGSWQEGEKIAQSGRGLTFSDKADEVVGGNCYACHQLHAQEISFGNIGPSLYRYGKLRGQSAEVIAYTYHKIYNSQAFHACSAMPRFGQQHILSEQQMQDVLALLLAPASPVNQ
jgi:sulfur-oxidizing protein SoxX